MKMLTSLFAPPLEECQQKGDSFTSSTYVFIVSLSTKYEYNSIQLYTTT
jgi:hypothetical protein